MTGKRILNGREAAAAIAQSGLSIYDEIDRESDLFFDIEVLEEHLRTELVGLNLAYPIRTRAKHSKSAVAKAMGYPVPKSFRKTHPRFPGQDLDVYVQKADNLQIWNEEISPSRRYAIIRLDADDSVTNVRIVTGETLARLDRTGTLTQKYQAKRRAGRAGSHLVSAQDTTTLTELFQPVSDLSPADLARIVPTARPIPGKVLTVGSLYERLLPMVGLEIVDRGLDQERNRGEALHRLVCQTLGLNGYADRGQFPDVLCQALEVKLQTSPTIDLGLVTPDSVEAAEEVGPGIRHCDVRYAIAYGRRLSPTQIEITELVVTTGLDFFSEFQRFEGLVQNKKLQVPLPGDFFREAE